MRGKTICIVTATVLVTIILMNNTEEIDFWIFGASRIPKLAVLGCMLGLGFILGFMAGRPRKKYVNPVNAEVENDSEETNSRRLSDEDRDYIS